MCVDEVRDNGADGEAGMEGAAVWVGEVTDDVSGGTDERTCEGTVGCGNDGAGEVGEAECSDSGENVEVGESGE